MALSITSTGVKLALLDGIKAEEERTQQRLIERLREKQIEMHRIQIEAKSIASRLLICQRQIAAIADEMSILISERRAA